MSLADDYKQQLGWRDWPSIFAALPPLRGQTIFDLGCGVGDQAAELLARGARRVLGVDSNQELLHAACARALAGAELHQADLHALPDLGAPADGIWSSFTAAYFPDLPAVLASWTRQLRPGGWIALTEIDDLFGHEPLGARARAGFAAYARDALAAGRYDFHMGGKLREHLQGAGCTVTKVLTLTDQELAFEGPATAPVVAAWRARFARMQLLRDFLGTDSEAVVEEFIACLERPEHHSLAKVCCCIATR